MSCVLDTDSIDLDDSGGVLQAALRLDPAVLNLLAVTAAGARVDPNGGWLALPAVLAYSSGTGTNEGVYTTSADLRPYVSAGMRIKFVQGGVTKYMEVVALDGTTITLYGGDQYPAAVGAITVPYFSFSVSPLGWPTLSTATLPVTAYDGWIINLVADAANGVVWRPRYNAGSGSSYKWEMADGAVPLSSQIATDETLNSLTYANLATVGPAVALPFAGDWDITTNATGYEGDNTLERHYISYAIGGTAAVDADAAICSYNSTGGGRFTYGRTKRQTGLTAVTLTMKYRKNATDGSNSNWLERSMKAAPVRIG
jgi:hypothetical protein